MPHRSAPPPASFPRSPSGAYATLWAFFLPLAALIPAPACSDESQGTAGDDRAFVPEDLPNTNVNGQDVGLTLIAFTLVQRPDGAELYAAARNQGDTPACEAGMTTDFFDKSHQRVSSAGAVLRGAGLYRLEDGTVLSCIAPGEIAMAASTDLPDAIVVDQLGHLEHLFPSFTLAGLAPIAGLTVADVKVVVSGTGSAYTGKVANGLDVPVSNAKVTIFPVNRVGRPLGAATSDAPFDIPPHGSWTFTTSSVDEVGVRYAAYPSASIRL